MYMAQLNMHTTPEFEEQLARLMQLRGIATKSEAIRVAVREGLARAVRGRSQELDFRDWIGAAREAELAPRPRFATDDDLWRTDRDGD